MATMISSRVPEFLAGVGLNAKQCDPGSIEWRELLGRSAYVPTAYTPSWIEYQTVYQRESCTIADISLVLYRDTRPCAVWPLTLSTSGGVHSISSHGLPLLPPLFIEVISRNSQVGILRRCLAFIQMIAETGEDWNIAGVDMFAGNPSTGFSDWYRESRRVGAAASIAQDLFVDLTLELDEIKSHFRKSYRPLINSGMRHWRVETMAGADDQRWEQFRELHVRAAGRETRSLDSWAVQYQSIMAGSAFLVYLLADDGLMVGAGFFAISRDEATYAVGAYDRSLFDRPLGHVVQYRAIEEMKRRGIRWYRLGVRPYVNDSPAPTQKEVAIGYFKEGFATHAFQRFALQYNFALDRERAVAQ